MSDCGFFHPDLGYWQTISEPTPEMLASYPAGTVQVPIKPGEGYAWTGSTWAPPAPVEPVVVVPQVVTRRQARQALLLAGRLQDVQPAIDAIADPLQRGMVQIEWDDSQEFRRDWPSLNLLASTVGMTAADLDALFVQAGAL